MASQEYFARKDAKAQSATAFLKGLLCAFASLRVKYLLLVASPVILFGAVPTAAPKYNVLLIASDDLRRYSQKTRMVHHPNKTANQNRIESADCFAR